MTWKDELRKILGEDPEDMTSFMNVSPRMKREAEERRGSKDSLEMAMKVDKKNIEGFIKAVSDYAYYGRELENSLKEMPELGRKLLKISEDALDELYDLGEEWIEAEEQLR
jgi:hypothetical protein